MRAVLIPFLCAAAVPGQTKSHQIEIVLAPKDDALLNFFAVAADVATLLFLLVRLAPRLGNVNGLLLEAKLLHARLVAEWRHCERHIAKTA